MEEDLEGSRGSNKQGYNAVYIYIYIYIYKERERERKREGISVTKLIQIKSCPQRTPSSYH